jgi:hypothetical protein
MRKSYLVNIQACSRVERYKVNLSLVLNYTPHHVEYGGGEVQLHAFLTSSLRRVTQRERHKRRLLHA